MFRVGDKVRRINIEGNQQVRLGEIYTIDGTRYDLPEYVNAEISLKESPGKHWAARNFVLVEENMTLEQLVKQANDGVKAMNTLNREFKDQVEFRPTSSVGTELDYIMKNSVPSYFNDNIDVFKIKPKPSFVPFTVGSNWLVKLEGDMVHVGCQKFNAKKLMEALHEMNHGVVSFDHFGMASTRKGPKYTGCLISWEDSEKIVAALEKAGVK